MLFGCGTNLEVGSVTNATETVTPKYIPRPSYNLSCIKGCLIKFNAMLLIFIMQNLNAKHRSRNPQIKLKNKIDVSAYRPCHYSLSYL